MNRISIVEFFKFDKNDKNGIDKQYKKIYDITKLGIIPNLKERFMNNYSKQREVILDIIKNNPIHPTAEEIYKLTIKKEPKISKSTVYRNINILVDLKKINKVKMTVGPDRYDYVYKDHSHMICEKCGKIFDFYYNFNKDDISKNLKQQLKENIIIDNIMIYGICEECKSKN